MHNKCPVQLQTSHVYLHASTSVSPSVKWGATCSTYSSKSKGVRTGVCRGFGRWGTNTRYYPAGQQQGGNPGTSCTFCFTRMYSLTHFSRAVCSVPTQAPGPLWCGRHGRSVTSPPSLEKSGQQGDGDPRADELNACVSAEELGEAPRAAWGRQSGGFLQEVAAWQNSAT